MLGRRTVLSMKYVFQKPGVAVVIKRTMSNGEITHDMAMMIMSGCF